LRDLRLINLVRRGRNLPGANLFTYRRDDGGHAPVTSADVNDYLGELTNEAFTAKDFRTWKGSTMATGLLLGQPV